VEWFVAQRDCARTTPKAPHHTGSLRVPIPPPKPATVVCVCVRAPPAALELRPRRERQVASHKTCPHALSRSPNPAHAPPARMPCVRVVGARSRTRRQRPRIIPSYSQRKTSTQPCAWAGRPTPFSFPEGPATRRGRIFFFFFFFTAALHRRRRALDWQGLQARLDCRGQGRGIPRMRRGGRGLLVKEKKGGASTPHRGGANTNQGGRAAAFFHCLHPHTNLHHSRARVRAHGFLAGAAAFLADLPVAAFSL